MKNKEEIEQPTTDQYLRFEVLVPLVVAIKHKDYVLEKGALVKQSAHLIYGEAINKIENYYKQRIDRAVLEANTFDNHLRKYLPHDGKPRTVSFSVTINPDDKLEFKGELEAQKGTHEL